MAQDARAGQVDHDVHSVGRRDRIERLAGTDFFTEQFCRPLGRAGQHRHPVPIGKQSLNQLLTDKAGAAGHQDVSRRGSKTDRR